MGDGGGGGGELFRTVLAKLNIAPKYCDRFDDELMT